LAERSIRLRSRGPHAVGRLLLPERTARLVAERLEIPVEQVSTVPVGQTVLTHAGGAPYASHTRSFRTRERAALRFSVPSQS
jgi:hypothetical protein